MQPTVYRHDPSKSRPIDLGLLACGVVLGLISLRHFVSDYAKSDSMSWLYLVLTVWFSVFAILWLLKLVGPGFLADKWAQTFLALDDQGLTYARGGMISPRRWSWAELSAFEYRGPARLRGPRILFRPVAPGVMDRLTMESTLSGMKCCFPNHFDAPPEEIAAKLNEYRERALGNGGTAPPV